MTSDRGIAVAGVCLAISGLVLDLGYATLGTDVALGVASGFTVLAVLGLLDRRDGSTASVGTVLALVLVAVWIGTLYVVAPPAARKATAVLGVGTAVYGSVLARVRGDRERSGNHPGSRNA